MEIIIQRRQIAERKENLDKLINSIKDTEDLIFDLMKESTPITVYTENNFKKLTEEDTKIRQILSITDPKADICQEFHNIVKRRMREIQKRHDQAEEYKKKLDAIKDDMKNTGFDFQQFKHSDTRRYIKGTLNKYLIEIRGLKQFINDSKADFSKYIGEMKQKFKEQFEKKKQTELDNVSKIQDQNLSLADQLEKLKQEKERLLAELQEMINNPKIKKPIEIKVDPERKIQEFNDMITKKRWKFKNFERRIKSFSLKVNFTLQINAKIDDIEAHIDSIIRKIKQGEAIIIRNRKLKEKKLLLQRQLNAQMNFLSLMRIGRLGMTVQKISRNLEPWFETQAKLVKNKMKEKAEPRIEVDGKQMTASELRKEIMRIEKINAETSYQQDLEIRQLEEEEEKYNKLTQAIYSNSKA